MNFAVVSSVVLPLLMVIGVVVAWRATKSQHHEEEQKPTWRDDSLDDWRKQRDATAEAERIDREQHPERYAGTSEEREETQRHQRIGG